jgi:gas vesicle protein
MFDELEVPMNDENGSHALGFFIAGLGIGAVMALLFAPKSGRETRKYIGKRAEKGRDYVSAKGKEVGEQVEEIVEKGKDLLTKQKELLTKQKDRLADALEAGKQAAFGR